MASGWKKVNQQNQQNQQLQAQQQANASPESIETQTTDNNMASDTQLASEPSPETTPAVPPATVAAVPNLEAMLLDATPEQLQKLGLIAASKGIAKSSSAGIKRADGSMTVDIYLEPPVVEQLEIWAEADGCTLIEEAQKRIGESLTNYLYGDWNPVVETAPVAVAETK